jgi:hypothetical protein
MVPTWFLYLTGFSMVILAGLQIYHRPRRKGAGLYERFVNLGTFWSLLCFAVGIALLAIALGYWQGPIGPPRAPPATRVPRYH